MAFDAQLAMTDSTAKITLTGSLDASSAPRFKEVIEQAAVQSPSRLVLLMTICISLPIFILDCLT